MPRAAAPSRGVIPTATSRGWALRSRITSRRVAHPGHGDGHHRGEIERAQSAQPLPPLGRVYGSRQLGRTRDLAPRRAGGGGMSEPVNIRSLAPGTRIVLEGGAVAEIVSNPADGVWVFARYLSAPDDPGRVGSEEMIFAQDIIEIGREP